LISTLLNIASVCFFIATLFSLHRKYKSRDKMDSTSLESYIFHAIGNFSIVIVSIMMNAWFALIAEMFLAILCLVQMYWKVRWLIKYWRIPKQ